MRLKILKFILVLALVASGACVAWWVLSGFSVTHQATSGTVQVDGATTDDPVNSANYPWLFGDPGSGKIGYVGTYTWMQLNSTTSLMFYKVLNTDAEVLRIFDLQEADIIWGLDCWRTGYFIMFRDASLSWWVRPVANPLPPRTLAIDPAVLIEAINTYRNTKQLRLGTPTPSLPPRHAPILIDNDADYSGLATSGSGTEGDPWILGDWLIECNNSGSGIVITGTDDHAIFRNIVVNESGTGASDVNIGIQAASNVDFENTSASFSGMINIAIIGENITFSNCTFTNSSEYNVYIDNALNIIINASAIENTSADALSDSEILFADVYGASDNVTIVNCSISSQDKYAITAAAGDAMNFTVSGCNITSSGGISAHTCNITVDGCTFTGMTSIYDCILVNTCNATVSVCVFNYSTPASTVSCVAWHNSNGTITGNTILDSANATSLDINDYSNLEISWNNFTHDYDDDTSGIWFQYSNTACNVTRNYVRYIDRWIRSCGHPNDDADVSIFENFYSEYFSWFPNATSDLPLDILDEPVTVPANLLACNSTDPTPAYYAPWFPREQQVHFRFFSNVDFEGIAFEQLKLYINSTLVTTQSPVISAVLFRVTVTDFNDTELYDSVYNLNETGQYVNIGLDVAVQVFVSYYSNFDLLGLSFDLVKLYIDGERITRHDPVMRHKIIDVQIRDFANRVLYDDTLNLSVTGIYLDFGLDIAYVVIENRFDFAVLFHYSINSVEVSIPIGAQKSIDDLRFSLGTYDWWVTDMDNHPVHDEDGSAISEEKRIAGPDSIEFGWITLAPAIDSTAILMGYMGLFMVAGLACGGIVIFTYWAKVSTRGKSRPRASREPSRNRSKSRPRRVSND